MMKLKIRCRGPYLSIMDDPDSRYQRAAHWCTYNVFFMIDNWTLSLQAVAFITAYLGHNMSLWLACALQSSVLGMHQLVLSLLWDINFKNLWFWHTWSWMHFMWKVWCYLLGVQLWTKCIVLMFNFFIVNYMDIVFKILWFWYPVEVSCVTSVSEHVSSAFRVEMCRMTLWCHIEAGVILPAT